MGSRKTQIAEIINGNRSDPVLIEKMEELFNKKGMLPNEINELLYYAGGSKMLKELLEKDVFSPSLNEKKEVFESDSFKLAQTVMKDALNLKKFVAIIGETGAGKTNLVRYLEEMTFTDNSIIISNLNNHDFEKVRARNIYEAILFDIQPDASPKRSTEALIRQVRQILTSLSREGKKVVLIVDEAHHINKRTLLALKDVWESTFGFSRLLGIILLGQEALAQKLDEPAVREVNTRLERIVLKSISNPEECQAYLNHLCSMKGVELNGTISDEAFKEIFQRRNSFLGINILTKDAVEIAIMAADESLSAHHFRNI